MEQYVMGDIMVSLDEIINDLDSLPYVEVKIGEKVIPILVQVEKIQQIVDDLKELRDAMEINQNDQLVCSGDLDLLSDNMFSANH